MRIKTLILQNFRKYHNRTVIPIDSLTAFIGKGDAGKSTILEALDIFFGGEVVTIENSDACIIGDSRQVRIGATFTDLPDELDLDRGAVTTLQDEYLTNSDGDLEIVKVFNCSVQKVAPPSVFANAFHPNAAGVLDLLHKSNSQLKNLIREQSLEDQCQQNNNPSMRQALYNAALDLQLSEREIPLNKEDAKNIWEAVRRSLPVYALFRSDRAK